MATIKPGDKVWLLAHVDTKPTRFIDDDGAECDPTFAASAAVIWKAAARGKALGSVSRGSTPVMPDHPALPKLAALLASDGPALAAAVTMGVDAMHQWDGLHGNGPAVDIEDAAAVERSRELLTRLAAALTEGTGDGNETD